MIRIDIHGKVASKVNIMSAIWNADTDTQIISFYNRYKNITDVGAIEFGMVYRMIGEGDGWLAYAPVMVVEKTEVICVQDFIREKWNEELYPTAK
jgi:hypothetical protein